MFLRFLVGGIVVALFSALGDVLKPKSFAGLLGAAPSVALATLGLTIASNGTAYAALEARSMIGGAVAAIRLHVVGDVGDVQIQAVRSPCCDRPSFCLACDCVWCLVFIFQIACQFDSISRHSDRSNGTKSFSDFSLEDLRPLQLA